MRHVNAVAKTVFNAVNVFTTPLLALFSARKKTKPTHQNDPCGAMQVTIDHYMSHVPPNFDSEDEGEVPMPLQHHPEDDLFEKELENIKHYSPRAEDVTLPPQNFTGMGPSVDSTALSHIENPVLTATGEYSSHAWNWYSMVFKQKWYGDLADATNLYATQKLAEQPDKYTTLPLF
jgi:hypothetical protein